MNAHVPSEATETSEMSLFGCPIAFGREPAFAWKWL